MDLLVDVSKQVSSSLPIPTEEATRVARKLLELLLTFEMPLSFRRNHGVFTRYAMINNNCLWLKLSIYYAEVEHSRLQGTVARMGGGCTRYSNRYPRTCHNSETRTYSLRCGVTARHPTPGTRPPIPPIPFRPLFDFDATTHLTAVSSKLTRRVLGKMHSYAADKRQALMKVQATLRK